MTALVFLASLALAWLHYATRGVFFDLPGVGTVTIYAAAFAATLASALTAAILSRAPRALTGAAVLVLNFAGVHYAWNYATDPILFQAATDVATAAYFVGLGGTRWEFSVGGLYLLSVGAAVLAHFGAIADHTTRPDVFIALSYPDAAALLGHAANVALGLGAGDAGRRIRVAAGARPVVADYRRSALARLGLVGPLAS